MSETVLQGRHRAPGRYNPISEFKVAMSRSAAPAVKSSAVLAASGGLVAAFAVPTTAAAEGSQLASSVDPVVAAGSAGIAAGGATAAGTSSTAASGERSASSAPVISAPNAAQKVSDPAVGLLAFTAVAKPKAKPIVRQLTSPVGGATSGGVDYAGAADRAAASGVIAVAQSLLGIYYLWGGTSPSTGFDCSGFTQYVFAKVGISLPRTAEAQRLASTRISNPQPGDLVFFGAPAYHVGIYAGNGMMYDSPTTGKTTGLHKIWSGNVTYGRP